MLLAVTSVFASSENIATPYTREAFWYDFDLLLDLHVTPRSPSVVRFVYWGRMAEILNRMGDV